MKPCSCGLDHSDSPSWPLVLDFIARCGDTLPLRVSGRTWRVPRVFIAMHGIKGAEVPALADRYGWEEIPDA